MKIGRFAAFRTRTVRPDRKPPTYSGGHRPRSAAVVPGKSSLSRRPPGEGRRVRPARTLRPQAWRPETLRSAGRTARTVRAVAAPRVLCTAVLIAAGLTAASAGAYAQPGPDPHQFSDRSTEFVPLGAPNALAARDTGKQLVLSPHGTRRSIVCRGNGTTVPLYDCSQEDGLGWAPLHRTETPVGEVWIYFP